MPLTHRALKDLRALRLKKHRHAQGQALVEGARLVGAALGSDAEVAQLFWTEAFAASPAALPLKSALQRRGLPPTDLTGTQAEQLAETRHPQGVFAVVAQPRVAPDAQRLLQPPILILDAIADPGNLGTLLRTADWFGLPTVWVSAESADVTSPKVLRAGAGAHFHLPTLWQGALPSLADRLAAGNTTLIGAVLDGAPLTAAALPGNDWALVVGSEAHGLSPFWRQRLDRALTIPGVGRAESLNAAVATGILLHYLRGGQEGAGPTAEWLAGKGN